MDCFTASDSGQSAHKPNMIRLFWFYTHSNAPEDTSQKVEIWVRGTSGPKKYKFESLESSIFRSDVDVLGVTQSQADPGARITRKRKLATCRCRSQQLTWHAVANVLQASSVNHGHERERDSGRKAMQDLLRWSRPRTRKAYKTMSMQRFYLGRSTMSCSFEHRLVAPDELALRFSI